MTWLAPILPFTMEESWAARGHDGSVHLETYFEADPAWRDDALAARWEKVRQVRRVVTGALEVGAAREAHRVVAGGPPDRPHRGRPPCAPRSSAVHFADVVIASAVTIETGAPDPNAFTLAEVPGIYVPVGQGRGPPLRPLVEGAAGGGLGPALSGPVAPRRRGDGRDRRRRRVSQPPAAPAPDRGASSGRARLWALLGAVAVVAVDQATKLWVLGLDLTAGPIRVAPFADITLVMNRGISYGLLQQDGWGRWLLVAFTVAASVALAVWLWRARRGITLGAIALILGGAIGNLIDRVLYGAVVDFVHLHWGTWSWYIFNVADAAIVVGVGLLLIESLFLRDDA